MEFLEFLMLTAAMTGLGCCLTLNLLHKLPCSPGIKIVAAKIQTRIAVTFLGGFIVPEFSRMNIEQHFVAQKRAADTER